MATQEMILKLLFNDDGTFAGLEQINKELKKVDQSTETTSKGFTSAKAELRALQNQMLQMDQSSVEFKKAAARAAELKDNISDLSSEINANAGNAFEGLSNNVGLFGSRLMDLDLAGAGQALRNMGTNVSRIDFKTLKDEIGGLISGFASLAKAIISNPILLLAGAIALVVANFDDLIKLFPSLEMGLSGINEIERENLAIATKKAQASQKAYDNIEKEANLLRLQGKSEKYILDFKLKELETTILDRKEQLAIIERQAITQIETAKRNREILEGIIKFLTAPLQALLGAVDEIAHTLGMDSDLANSFTNMAAGLLIDPQELEAELNKTIEENKAAISTMEDNYVQLKISLKKIDEDAAKTKKENLAKQNDDLAKANEEAKKLYQDKRNAEIEAEDAKYKALQELQESALEKEITSAIDASEELYRLAGDDAAAEILIAENLKKQIADINKKYADEAKAAELKADNEAAESRLKEIDDEKKKEEAKAAIRMANISAGFEMASLGLDALMNLNEAAAKGDEASQRKTFERNKLMQKAQATIAMAAGIVQQLAVPQDQLTGMNFVKAAAVAAAGVANIVKINQTQFTGGTPPSTSNLTAPTGTANAPAIDFSGANMQVNAPGSTETYVLAGNVANALEARQKIIDQSHL
jgi:hypothetical protein